MFTFIFTLIRNVKKLGGSTMKKRMLRLIALAMTLTMFAVGCGNGTSDTDADTPKQQDDKIGRAHV